MIEHLNFISYVFIYTYIFLFFERLLLKKYLSKVHCVTVRDFMSFLDLFVYLICSYVLFHIQLHIIEFAKNIFPHY